MPVPVDGSLPQDLKGYPAGSVYAPNVGTVAAQGGPVLTDASGQPYAPAVVNATISSISGPITSNIFGPSSTDNYQATVAAAIGEMRVALQPSQTFYDAFDIGLDTTNRWKIPSSGGGGIPAVNETTDTRLGTGTTANGYSYLESQMSFLQANPGWVMLNVSISLEFPLISNTYRFWGFGTSPLAPTTTIPLVEACGFEMTTSGKLFAVTYQTTSRVAIQDLSVSTGNGKQPQDANSHLYMIYYRGDRILWAIDNLDNIVAQTTTGAPGPNINALPIKFTAIAAPTPPISNAQVQVNAVWVGDTARNNAQISDGVFPWRKATISQFHNTDNQSLPTSPASYGILTGGVSQLVNPLGNLDRQRETGQDQISQIGISSSAVNFAQSFQTTVQTLGSIVVGSSSAIIAPSNMFGIQIGTLLTLDISNNTETAVVTSIGTTGTTATIVPTNTVNNVFSFKFSHTVPYQITGFVYNQQRDQNGELDIPRGVGMAAQLPLLSISSGQGTTNPIIAVRERGVQGLGLSAPIQILSGAQGSTTLILVSTPTSLLQGSPLYLSGGGGYERVLTALNYTPGSSTILLDIATPILGNARTTAQYITFAAGGPMGNPFYPEGEGAEFQAGIDLTAVNGPPGRMFQVATQNNAPYANSPLEAIGLDNSLSLDRMAGNQSLALISVTNSTSTVFSADQININARGVKIFVNTTNTSSSSVTVSIQFKDPFLNYVTMLSTTPITTVGQSILTIHPGLLNVANTSLNDFLPRIWRVIATANTTGISSYTVSAMTVI